MDKNEDLISLIEQALHLKKRRYMDNLVTGILGAALFICVVAIIIL